MQDGFNEQSVFGKVVYMLATGRHSGILWFIPMIAVFYLLSIVLIKWAKTKSFNYITPVLVILGLWTNQFGYYSNIALSFLHFLPVYLFGMWLAKFKEAVFDKSLIWLLLCFVAYIILSLMEVFEFIKVTDLINERNSTILTLHFNPGKLKATLLCVVLILFFKHFDSKKFRLLDLTGNYSFGIFFIHLYCINVFQLVYKKGLVPISGLNLFSYLLYVTVIVLLCLLIVHSIKFIFKRNSRLLIGS